LLAAFHERCRRDDRIDRGTDRMVDLILAFFSHVLIGDAITCRKPSPQLSTGLLLSRGFPAFGQRVMWKTIPRPGRWKRLESAARAFYPSFEFIPTSRQILVIATPMRSPAGLSRKALSVISSLFSVLCSLLSAVPIKERW
jgi:hypothetical protein